MEQVLHNQLGQLGFEFDLVRVSVSPLGKCLYLNYKNVCDHNKKDLDRACEEMSMYNHCKIEWKKGTDTHIILTRYYDQPKILLSQIANRRDIIVGRDIENNNITINFDQCPHILIAGTTGSGKSVLMNNIICNLYSNYSLGQNKFKQMQMVLIDPKGTEFNHYRALPNTTFVCETQQAIEKLRWACNEMDYRYRYPTDAHKDMYIIVDELADLMLTSKFEVEEYIVRLAQKGRACGIHLILATQSPRVAVISGLIKANITTKFILKVASVRESVTCLDHKGCEELRGNGDCIVKFPYSVNETRFQVALVDTSYLNQVIQSYRFRP